MWVARPVHLPGKPICRTPLPPLTFFFDDILLYNPMQGGSQP